MGTLPACLSCVCAARWGLFALALAVGLGLGQQRERHCGMRGRSEGVWRVKKAGRPGRDGCIEDRRCVCVRVGLTLRLGGRLICVYHSVV